MSNKAKQPTPAPSNKTTPPVGKPAAKERVKRKEERAAEASGGGQGWVSADVYVGGKTDRTLLEQRLLARFRGRPWAVRLTVNGEPVNHPQRHVQRAVSYWYDWKETPPDAVARFMDAVERAAAKSWEGPTGLFIRWAVGPSRDMEGWLIELLDAGPDLVWPDGSSPRLCRGNFIVDLYFEPTSPVAWEQVARIVGDGGGQ